MHQKSGDSTSSATGKEEPSRPAIQMLPVSVATSTLSSLIAAISRAAPEFHALPVSSVWMERGFANVHLILRSSFIVRLKAPKKVQPPVYLYCFAEFARLHLNRPHISTLTSSYYTRPERLIL